MTMYDLHGKLSYSPANSAFMPKCFRSVRQVYLSGIFNFSPGEVIKHTSVVYNSRSISTMIKAKSLSKLSYYNYRKFISIIEESLGFQENIPLNDWCFLRQKKANLDIFFVLQDMLSNILSPGVFIARKGQQVCVKCYNINEQPILNP